MLQGFVPFVSQNKLMLKHNQLLVTAVSRSSFVSLVPTSPFILPYIHTYTLFGAAVAYWSEGLPVRSPSSVYTCPLAPCRLWCDRLALNGWRFVTPANSHRVLFTRTHRCRRLQICGEILYQTWCIDYSLVNRLNSASFECGSAAEPTQLSSFSSCGYTTQHPKSPYL